MARNLFGGTADSVAEDSSGARVPNAVGTVWDSPSAGATQLTDLTDESGAPLQQLQADATGYIAPFYGPDGYERVWLDFGAGRVALVSVTVGERLDSHLTDLDPHGDRAYADSTFLKASAAGWAAAPNALQNVSKGVRVPLNWGEFWRPKRDAAKAATGKATVAVIGGSSAAGFYASNLATKSWPGVLATNLQSSFGDGGSGFYSAMISAQGIGGSDAAAITQWTNSGGLVTQSGTWSIGGYQAGPGWGYLYSSTNGNTLTFTVRGTSVTIYTLGSDGAHSPWSYSIDGATAVAVSDTGTSGLAVLTKTVTGLSAGTHTVRITHTGSSSQYLAVCGVSGENANGIVVNNFGKRNASAGQYVPPLKAAWTGGPSYPADCVVYMLSPDDVINGLSADSWASNVRQHFTAIRDSGSATGATDLVLVLPHIGQADFSNQRYQDFVERAHGLSVAFEAALIDLWGLGRNSWNYWNSLGYWADSTKPGSAGTDAYLISDAGHSYTAGVINSLLSS
ncbi:hypothetical protein GTY75_05145 [Streptomyces sp. SID8381]|uniref:hypothetical protein n=1 Tax=unclassified Streptomyces TaxID=2593676 RepID=UPI000370688E|nr:MULTISPECIES: hypothetical protein [unclassified Streptomyces]MYX26059.1 hypothetical protein [Streptomyces sp. SID8381]